MLRTINSAEVTVQHPLKFGYPLDKFVFKLNVIVGNLRFATPVLFQSVFVIFLDVSKVQHLQFPSFAPFINHINLTFFGSDGTLGCCLKVGNFVHANIPFFGR